MALGFNFLKRLVRGELRAGFQDNTPVGMPVGGVQSFISSWAETGRYITPDQARSAPSVHACTMLISQSIARMEWKILQDTGTHRAPVRAHPLYRLLNVEPSVFMGALTWRQSMLLDCLLYGNGYSWIERDPSGRPTGLEKLRPDLMTVMRDERNQVVYQYAAGLPGARTFPAYEVFHLIGPSSDGLIGEPPINLARQMIGVELEAEAYVANFFANGARPAGVLQVQGTLSPEAYKRLKDTWQETQGGARNAGRVAILEAGYEFKQISVDPDDAQLIELRRYCREQIAACFGVPPHMIGESAKQSYASAEQADIEFTKHTLGSWAARLEEEAQRKLVRQDDNIITEISFEALTRGDLGGRFGAYATALQHGILTINEIRAREGMAPVPGGEHIRAPLNLGPLPTKVREPSDAPAGPDATAHGIGQLQALTALTQAIAKGELPADAGSGIVAAAFPLLKPDLITAIIGPAAKAAATAAQKPPEAPPPKGAPPPHPSGPEPPGEAQATLVNSGPDLPPQARDCGTGGGGFQSGNSCAAGGGDLSGVPLASDLPGKGEPLGGSTGARLHTDADGDQWVVKHGAHPDHIVAEAQANDLYRAAGVTVPETRLDASDPAHPAQIARFVDGEPLGATSGAARTAAVESIRDGFATDALLANWDVVGLAADNIIVPTDGGPPIRVDNGGSLGFRAHGKAKDFGAKVGELDSMRTSPQGKPIFGSLSNSEVAGQIRRLGKRRARIMSACKDKGTRTTIAARLDYMEGWAAKNGGEARDCGTGGGGFKPGNKCAGGGEGGGGEALSDEHTGGTTIDQDLGVAVPNDYARTREYHTSNGKAIAAEIGVEDQYDLTLRNGATTTDELMTDASEVAGDFKAIVEAAASDGGGMAEFGDGGKNLLKDKASLTRKIEGRMQAEGISEQAVVSRISDAVRGTVVVDDPKQLGEAVKSFTADILDGGGKVSVQNKFDDDLASGYMAVHVDTMMTAPSGRTVRGEVQFQLRGMLPAKKQAHAIYKKAQSGIKTAAANAAMTLIYAAAAAAVLKGAH